MMDHDEIDRELRARAWQLTREVAPPPEAWHSIHAAITAPAKPAGSVPVRYWQRPSFLAAAALVLIATSSALTAAVVNRDRPAAARADVLASSRGERTALAEFTARENDYLHLVNTLVAAVEDESAGLSPETIAIVRANLLVIDAAILEARRALAEDPNNGRLVEILASTYEKKLDLLRRTSAMARS